jgi:catecholate siderophore receptor
MPVRLSAPSERFRTRLLTHGVLLSVLCTGASLAPAGRSAAQTVLPPISVETDQTVQPTYRREETSQPKFGGEIKDTPQSITVITEELMEQQRVSRVRDALRNVPGVTIGIGEGGNQGDTFLLRGFTARGDLYMDGMRDLPSFNRDSFNLEALEVFKGPSSTLFGRGSTGGGINQVSKLPQPKSFYELEGGIGNADYYRGTGDFNHAFNESIAVRMPVMAETSGVVDRDVTEQNRWGVAPSVTFGLNNPTKFTLSYLHLQDDNIPDYGIPVYFGKPAPVKRSNFYGYRDFDYEKDWADVLTGQLKHEWNSSLSATQSLRYARVSREQSPTSPRVPGATREFTPIESVAITRNKPTNDRFTETWTSQTDGSAAVTTWDIRHKLNGGIELQREWFEQKGYSLAFNSAANFLNPNPDDRSPLKGPITSATKTWTQTQAIYAMDTIAVTNWLDLVGGLRFDRFSAHFENVPNRASLDSIDHIWSKRAGVVFKPQDWQSYYFSWGTSANPSAEFLTLSANNAFLDPEKTETYEIGSKWEILGKKLFVTSAIYRILKSNARVPDPAYLSFQVLNGEQKVDGGEISVTGQITDKWQVIAGLNIMSSVNYSTNATEHRKDLQNAPDRAANLWTSYLVLPRWTVGGGVFYQSRQYGNLANNVEIPGWVRFDAMTSYEVDKSILFQLNINNLFDREYIGSGYSGHMVPAPGRTAILSAKLKF